MPQPRPRLLYSCTVLACAGLLGFGYWLQFHDGLEPCPMCIFQRLCFMGVALICALGAIHGPRGGGRFAYGGLTILFALTGAGIAARQVWLQHLPEDRIPACGPGLEYMLEMYPLADVVRKALRGSGDCAVVDWTFLGLSIAEWSLACFSTLIIIHGAALWRNAREPAPDGAYRHGP